jgi:YidC/Oxa1 family membrane protein insertase
LLDQERDSKQATYQLLVVMIVTMAAMAFMFFLTPTPPPQQPIPEGGAPAVDLAAEEPAGLTPELFVAAESPAGEKAEAWPNLPPVAGPETDLPEDVSIADDTLELTFTAVGGRLKQARLLLGRAVGDDVVQIVPESTEASDTTAIYPLGLRFSDAQLGDELDRRIWQTQVAPDGRSVTFTIELPGAARVTKRFSLSERRYVLDAEVSYANLEGAARRLGMDAVPAYSLNWGPNVISGDLLKGLGQEVVWRKDEENIHHPTTSLTLATEGPYFDQIWSPAWLAVKSAYFVVAMKPEFEGSMAWVMGTHEQFRVGLAAPRTEIAPGAADVRAFTLYLGPTHLETLQAAWPGLDEVLQFFTWSGIMDWFAKMLLGVLNWFHDNVYANYGVAIIFLTILVRVVVFPLTYKSMKSMRKMQLLAPELQKIKEEVGEDPQEMQKRTMEMYKEYGVNPLGGCLPMLLQMPVFFALYRMLWSAYELRRAPFVGWINDLSEPDKFWIFLDPGIPMPFGMAPLHSLNVLPILMVVAMIASMKIMPTSGPVQNPQQKIIMTIMPVFFGLITYNMAAGLNLYILTSTLLGIGQNYLMHFSNVELEPKKTARRPQKRQHFYNAAQAKKRQLAKETRQDKRRGKPRPGDDKKREERISEPKEQAPRS